MDPRPYHFEYRRPRFANPTYESSNLYGSIYQLKAGERHGEPRNPQLKSRFEASDSIKRANSSDLSKKQDVGELGYRYRGSSHTDLPAAGDKPQRKDSRLASYGDHLMRNSSMDQNEVYEKQQKQFNIISFYPKRYRPNLKQFPKLTLEDRLLEHQ